VGGGVVSARSEARTSMDVPTCMFEWSTPCSYSHTVTDQAAVPQCQPACAADILCLSWWSKWLRSSWMGSSSAGPSLWVGSAVVRRTGE
jgi:hypothetical protein